MYITRHEQILIKMYTKSDKVVVAALIIIIEMCVIRHIIIQQVISLIIVQTNVDNCNHLYLTAASPRYGVSNTYDAYRRKSINFDGSWPSNYLYAILFGL